MSLCKYCRDEPPELHCQVCSKLSEPKGEIYMYRRHEGKSTFGLQLKIVQELLDKVNQFKMK